MKIRNATEKNKQDIGGLKRGTTKFGENNNSSGQKKSASSDLDLELIDEMNTDLRKIRIEFDDFKKQIYKDIMNTGNNKQDINAIAAEMEGKIN